VNKDTPLASIIVVCWNSADVIGSCLDHLLAQDYPSFEIIVVDDGSTDRTVDLAEEFLGTGKLTIVQSPLNRGCPHARNLGIRQAAGEIVAFVDGDGFATPGWLSQMVSEFTRDSSVGGVASTVFMNANPLVLNGAGGTINRQGWAADLSMNIPYGRARLDSEALYPMGCGMAIRRSALERVGLFDDRMHNYYDDVDYGIRLWRAGYRVVVARDAWVDHGFGHSGGDSSHKQLLCEQHRMRVILKHAPLRTLPRWVSHEASALLHSAWPRRELKHKAISWNLRHLSSTLNARRHLRGSSHVPKRLVDPSWGEQFPVGVPQLARPNPAAAKSYVDVADPDVDQQLPYGWYPTDRIHGRSYRWAGLQAAALIRLDESADTLRLDYAPTPGDLGGVDVEIRRLGSRAPLPPVWSTRLLWQYSERVIENYPVALPAGDYEVLFSSERAWSDPPSETRSLTFALAKLGFEHARELPLGGVMMSVPSASPQLVRGWYEPEGADDQTYRWSSRRAALLVRLPRGACAAHLNYRLPPGPIGGVTVSVIRLHHCRASSSTRIKWLDGHWHSARIPLNLRPGHYLVRFDADGTWSNWHGHDPSCAPENRALGIAVSTLSFDEGTNAGAQS
jgi:GT2 family glycosyltransferase